jgi:Bacterial regulatory proteins, tetR family
MLPLSSLCILFPSRFEAAGRPALSRSRRASVRGRPCCPAAEERTSRHGQILAAARTEFARRGFDATTVRDIAGIAGTGRVRASNRQRLRPGPLNPA